jgi:hypothetical protein
MSMVGSARWACLVFLISVSFISPRIAQTTAISNCVQCHTDVKRLIRLGWEVEKIRGKPQVSAETEGEG